ncbi:hypothetical protein A2U01_0044810, partial [Trifolium medium]|nr:hypothetical protein [Trifolium medium]
FAIGDGRAVENPAKVAPSSVLHHAEDDFLPRTATPLEDIFKSIF